MKSSEFRSTMTRSCTEHRGALQKLVGAVVSLALALPAFAQAPPSDPLPKATEKVSATLTRSRVTERQSQVNPASKAHGDTTNRGRMSGDFLWGMTNGNRTYTKTPVGRIPDQGLNDSIQPDGFTAPYPVDNTGGVYRRKPTVGLGSTAEALYPSIRFDDEVSAPSIVSVVHPVTGIGTTGGFFQGAGWLVATDPTRQGGAGYINNQYTRAAAVARPAGAVPNPGDPNDPSKFIWYPNVPGAAGELHRYAVRLHIPTVEATGVETRISDARYIVSYIVQKTNGTYLYKRKVCTLNQTATGDVWLVGEDGKPAIFTFFSEATYTDPAWRNIPFANGLTYGDPLTRARVELDNTTEDDITGTQYVIADQIEFIQRLAAGSAKGTPTLTPPHGGRKVDTTQPKPVVPTTPDADPYDQPAAGTNYALDIWNTGGGLAFLNDSFNFINNPRDPAYALGGDPLFGKFDPASPSTLFRGPESLLDPKNAMGVSVLPPDAENHQQYKDGLGNAVPYFSHLQVLVNKTDYVMDPETGTPDSEVDGTKTIEVGSITAYDWATGTQLWRFPDKTYLPALSTGAAWRNPDNTLMIGAALRNPFDPVDLINLIPGISAIDKNGNGKYDDDEIFLVGQGSNPNGGLDGSPTIVPNMQVMGDVKVPQYTSLGGGRFEVNGVVSAPLFRYSQPDPMNPLTGRLPIHMPLAFIGGNNGVLYALDPFGNNDNQYIERAPIAGINRSLGEYKPGTTNLLWTFSPTSKRRVISGTKAEALDRYNLRLKGEIPVPAAFGASSPVVVWAKQDDNDTLDRLSEEPRLFIGNQNGIIYALDPRANAGTDIATGTGMASLPVRKGEQVVHDETSYNAPGVATPISTRHRTALKWWFETNGPINATLAVSDAAFARNAGAGITASRRLFATTAEGRVYSLDWDGPVTKMNHELNMVWDGSSGVEPFLTTTPPVPPIPTTRPIFGTASALNDTARFHTTLAARPNARPDYTEGTIRPVWAFPGRYADVSDLGGGTIDNRTGLDQPDFSLAYPGFRLATPDTQLASLYSAPVVMDFAIKDTDSGVTGLTGIRRTLLVVANDRDSTTDLPKQGRVLMLDQEGDRNDFLTNPMPSRATAKFTPSDPAVTTTRPSGPTAKPNPAIGATIYSQPLDEYVWKDGTFGKAAPVWTYRSVYDTYDASSNPIIRRRNRPTPGVAIEPTTLIAAPVTGEPARRTLPTVFWGGMGRLFALDIDEETGLFLRWRKLADPQPAPIPLDGSLPIPPSLTAQANGDFLNPNEPITGNPFSPIFNVGNQNTLGLGINHIMARTVPLLGDASSVDGQLVVTGGPVQNRNNTTAVAAAAALANTQPAPLGAGDPTVPLVPTLDAPITKPILTLEPQVILDPVGPIVYDLNPFGYDLDLTASLGAAIPFPTAIFLPIVDLTGRFVNQDIGDPLATTLGSWPGIIAPTLAESQNLAYQYPTLIVTTQGGFLHEISTNIEGQDPSVATDPGIPGAGGIGNQYGPLGWAFTDGDLNAFNPHGHVQMFSMIGPGGTGNGVSVITNAYFPSMDTGYARRKDRLTKQVSTAPFPDPSRRLLAYPRNEPRSLTSAYGDGPRPGFLPRGLYPGNAADATGDPVIDAVEPDWHTGQTGFPLDLHGLFYDKRFARASATNHNADGLLKLPAYDQQGILSVTPPTTTGIPETNIERRNHVVTMTADANDNPAGQNVTWIYATGEDGIFYAYTPVMNPSLGGRPSGWGGGNPNQSYPAGRVARPRIDIFDEQDFNALRIAARGGTPVRPDRDGTDQAFVNVAENLNDFFAPMATYPFGAGRSVTDASRRSSAAKGSKNIYEWGETIRIVAWDVTVVASQLAPPFGVLSPVPATFQATITVRSVATGQVVSRPVSLERSTASGLVSTYPYVSTYTVPPAETPGGNRPAQLGLAFLELKLDEGLGLPMTPGTPIEVDIQANNPIGLGINANFSVSTGGVLSERSRFLKPQLFVANPLAVQGFVAATNSSVPLQARKDAGQPVAGGIGPFVTPPTNNLLSPVRGRVAGQNPTAAMDPDLTGFEYSQALANGNNIARLDYDRYVPAGMGAIQLNPSFGRRLQANGGTDPEFYVPVAASTGYIGHGLTGSTDLSATQRNLRIVNRTSNSLSNVRVEVMDDLIWRWWPGRIPNADIDASNPVITPAGMRTDGRINPLPWEREVAQAQPWKRRSTGNVVGLGNISPDYPDILAASTAQQGRQAISVLVGGSDAIQGPVSLPSGQLTNTANGLGATLPFLPSNFSTFGATVNVRVPQFQPANLVATHSMTSTYEAPSSVDGAQPFVGEGRLQLPRGLANRDLHQYNPGTNLFTGGFAITPFGYTSRLKVYVDSGSGNGTSNGNGRWDSGEPFRIVEVWTGVPVDMGLRSTESPVDLGALPAGFGIQNGQMGYQSGGANNPGFLPDPIGRLNPANPNDRAPYDKFFKKMTIQNTGNVNLYNLRAAQKTELLTDVDVQTVAGFAYFGLVSETVDSRYGILAVGADSALAANAPYTPASLMPQVVTSLDRQFDAAFNNYLQVQSTLATSWLSQVTDNGQTVYQRYYAGLAGRHTLHKPAVGSSTPAVLSLPDVPGNSVLVPDVLGVPQPDPTLPSLGIAVPIGTPVGVYRSLTTASPTVPPSLAIFEDHDTILPAGHPLAATNLTGYAGAPILTANASVSTGGANLAPAGPLYSNQNSAPPGLSPILPAGTEGILRARSFSVSGGTMTSVEFQPHTNPAVDIKLTVTETPLTGQIADFASIGSDGIFSGLLNGIDPKPLIEVVAPGTIRPASVVTPAAYRGANGRISVYYSRNVDGTTGQALTSATSPFGLFHSHLNWDPIQGSFQASVPGVPLADPTSNQARWFTQEVMLQTGAGESNIFPSVLQASPTATQATLFWVNSKPNTGALPTDTILWTGLDANGVPVDNGRELINTNNPNYQPDPTIRRFGPKGAFDAATNTGLVAFYGGAPGKQGLYYVPYTANPNGVPLQVGGRRGMTEIPLPVPPGIITAAEPSAIARRLVIPDHSVGSYSAGVFNPTVDPNRPVMDVVYTGVLRNTQTPDIFLGRYVFAKDPTTGNPLTGRFARLTLAALPQISGERLVQVGRDQVWRSKHIAWYVRGQVDPADNKYVVENLNVTVLRPGRTALTTLPKAWEYDTNSRRWAQILTQDALGNRLTGGVLYVYVDGETGEIRFRGAEEPQATDTVQATYQPTTYRLTPDAASDSGVFVTTDNRLTAALPYAQVYRWMQGPNPLAPAAARPGLGRQWFTWSKGAQPNRPARLYYATRRMGVDLRSSNIQGARLTGNESIALTPRDVTTGTQIPIVSNVMVAGIGSVPYEVDFATGRIFVDPVYEGLTIQVNYTAAVPGAGTNNRQATARLDYIEELSPTDNYSMGVQAPMQQTINEAQVYSFVDLFNYDPSQPDLLRTMPNTRVPAYQGDPTLQPGKLWMFWTSSRPRGGRVPDGGGFLTVPSGFDLFYQTIAPRFEIPTFTPL